MYEKKGYKNNTNLLTDGAPQGIICLVWDLYSTEYRLHRLGVGSARAIFYYKALYNVKDLTFL